MKKKFKIVEEFSKDAIGNIELSTDDYQSSIDEQRKKIRTLSSALISVSGMLLSANFIVLFFLLKETKQSFLINISLVISFAVAILLLVSLSYSIRAVYLESPQGVSTKGEKLLNQQSIFMRERSNIGIGYRLLFFSIFLFIVVMFLTTYVYYL